MKRLSKLLMVSVAALISNAAWALDPIYTGYFSDQAIKGYDTVAYFTENKPVEGKEQFSTEYMQANWLFSSQENLQLFKANPEKYVPQYGGYCAYAVSQNSTASIKPELFTIQDGKLYLNYNESVNQKWSANKEDYIELADKHWPGLLAQ
jgi:YHS domain-containing protein